jgi:hypothetical protein
MNSLLHAQSVGTAKSAVKIGNFLIERPSTTFSDQQSPELFDLITVNDIVGLQEP